MTIWLIGAIVLLIGLIPCLIVITRGKIMERFAALQMAQIIVVMIMIMMAIGFNRMICLDIPLSLSVLSLAGSMVYVRFLERWI